VIRQGTRDDAQGVARVQVRTWQAAYAGLLPSDGLSRMSVDRAAEQWQAHPPLVAEQDGEIMGFVSMGASRDDDADGELFAIYVEPGRWGTGVGRALIDAAEARLRERGYRDVILWVLEDNSRARLFYEAAGWQADGGRRPIEIFGVSFPEVRYRKRL
jgi:GNAT superfamily N-acetyltransferase